MSLLLYFVPFTLQGVLLFRAIVDRRLLRRYSSFYIYLGCGFLVIPCLIGAAIHLSADTYASVYWYADFVSDLMTCAVLWEVTDKIFANVVSVKCFVRFFKAAVGLVATVFSVLFILQRTVRQFGDIGPFTFCRDMLASEMVLLMLLVGGVLYFGVPLGRNAKGLLFGFGIQICGVTGLWSLDLASVTIYNQVAQTVGLLISCAYLIVWLASLWNYDPDPALDLEQLRLEFGANISNRIRDIKEFALAFFAGPFKLRNPSQ